MNVSTDASEHCPRCRVLRAPLNVGGWCETCGWNPIYEAQLQDLRSALAAQVLHMPTVRYDGEHPDENGIRWIWLKISRDEWEQWVNRRETPVP